MRGPIKFPGVCGSIVVLLLGGVLHAADWNQWRGPTRDGIVADLVVPEAWPKVLKLVWKIEVGEGYSGPVTAGKRVYLLSREGENEVVRAIDLVSGKPLWSHDYPAPYTPSPYAGAHGKGPKATPVVADGRLVTVGIGSIVTCWDADSGTQIWQEDFSKRFKKPTPLFYGMAVSPLIADKRIVTWVGGAADGAFSAFDLDSGKTIWKWTAEGAGYASPILGTWQGKRQLVCQSREACIGIDPRDGRLLWSLPLKTDYDQDIVTPLVADGRIIVSGLGNGTAAYVPRKMDAGSWKLDKQWENPAISMYMSSPVTVNKRIYGLANRSKGQFFCLDSDTGKTLWTSAGRMGENAALVAGGTGTNAVIMALVTGGELIVFKDDAAKFVQLARYKVSESPTWAHPAVVGNKILIKDGTSLTLWSLGG